MNAPAPSIITDQFVHIPEARLDGGLVVREFDAGMYLSSKGADGKMVITADGTPWNNINYFDAIAACEAAGYKLQTDLQAVAIAHWIAADDRNWTGGKVGVGKLFQGLRKWNVNGPMAGTYEPTDLDERRYFYLPDGQKIYDVAGNLWEWLFATIGADDKGVLNKAFGKDDPRLIVPYPGRDVGQGYGPTAGRDWSGNALFRGGSWRSYSLAGVFALDRYDPRSGWYSVGFRSTKEGR